MNLHGLVRGAIQTVNPDITGQWLASTGGTPNAAGKLTPTYAAAQTVGMQVQPVNGQLLQKYNFLQAQGIYRAVYLYGSVQGVVRVQARGGDLLKFPAESGGPTFTWLVRAVDETWTDANGWCRVVVSLQLDPNNPI